MSQNKTPLPDKTSDEWAIYIYEQMIEKEISKYRNILNQVFTSREDNGQLFIKIFTPPGE